MFLRNTLVKLPISLLLSVQLFTVCAAIETDDTRYIEALESSLFGVTHAVTHPLGERINTLESWVYGSVNKTNSSTQRLEQLMRIVLPDVQLLGKGVETSTSTQQHYPSVDKLEQRLAIPTHADDAIEIRLNRLEQRQFQKTYEDLPLVDRIDQLVIKTMPDSQLNQEEQWSATPLPQKGDALVGSNLAVYDVINQLERKVLKRDYGGQLLGQRLTRLEQALFGRAMLGSIDSRLLRLQQHTRSSSVASLSQRSSSLAVRNNAYLNREYLLLPSPESLPKLQQELTVFETQLFRRSFEGLPPLQRIAQLELKAFGLSYPYLPYQQRVNRLRWSVKYSQSHN
jgi:hypothetical protein